VQCYIEIGRKCEEKLAVLYVNGEKVEEREIVQEVDRLRPHYERVFADQNPEQQQLQLYEWSRENVIERVLLRQAAFREVEILSPEVIERAYESLIEQHGGKAEFYREAGMTEDQEWEVKKDLDRQMRFERLIEIITAGAPNPTARDIRAYYEENTDQFTSPEMVRAAHIVRHCKPGEDAEDLRQEMETVLDKLRNGEDFEQLALEHSDCPENGGDLGFFPRGQMVQAFDDVVFALEVGETSEVFRTEFGYHIAKVNDKKAASTYPLEHVREAIARELRQQFQQKAIEGFVDKEKAEATIEDK